VRGIGPKGKTTFHSKVVIDASGFPSTVCKAMGFATQWERFGAGAEYEVKVENVDSETWWLMVGQQYSPAGYAWIFPLGNNIVRIGVGIGKPESNVDPAQRLKELMETKPGPIKKLGKITPIEFHYGLIPNDGLSRKTVFNNLILVGDSAGQANPLVLEGIRYAIKFGRVAGKVSSDAIKSGKTDESSLYPYEVNWRKDIESKINSAGKVQDRWIGLSDEEWDKELDIIKELKAEEFIDFIKADFGLSNMIKLATRHPKLAVRQLFSLVKGKN
jgi:digeranylgeranylglycerophospholipid reductase